jgi:hypothetical protein
MRNLLALIGLFVVVFVGVGWYCEWYTLDIQKNSEGKLQIQTEVNTNKVSDDASGFFQTIGRLISEKMEREGTPKTAPGSTPGPATSPTPPAPTNSFSGGWLFFPQRPTSPRSP